MIRPSIREIPFQADTEQLFSRFRHLDGAVWLDSGKPRSLQGRFDLISALPEFQLVNNGDTTRMIARDGEQHTHGGDPFARAWALMESQGLAGDDFTHLPFCGGLIGYFSYDLGEAQHGIQRQHAPHQPLMHLGWYGWGIVTNHQSSKSWLIFHPACSESTRQCVEALLDAENTAPAARGAPFRLTSAFKAVANHSDYLHALGRIRDYIQAGDCYQVNFARQQRASYTGDPWQAYCQLRRTSPSPYSAYLSWGDRTLLCCSPERFLKVSTGKVETKPIKGTLPRGETLARDQENAITLQNSAKDRAENLMIVDLLRNDLGINCTTGSVRVPKLFALESFANVHHLVSTITGDLAADKTPLDLLRDAFPGGSITGAPKRRAMEIIAELEHQTRGIYCGSIGYISANGRMDTNIAIRTLEASNGTITCWGGGGIIADSDAQKEFAEAKHKVANLIGCLEEH